VAKNFIYIILFKALIHQNNGGNSLSGRYLIAKLYSFKEIKKMNLGLSQ
jgi:hypothetical protein